MDTLLITVCNCWFFSGCKFRAEVLLISKYNLFIIVHTKEYRELCVSKEPVWGSTCSVYCAEEGHEKGKIRLANIQNSTSFFAESQS